MRPSISEGRGNMRRIVGLLVALGLTLTPTVSGTAVPIQGATVRVRMVDNAFRPRTIEVERGTRVRWVNAGDNVHTTTSNRGIWDSGLLDPGETFSRVFRRSGTFRYHCSVHTSMTGRIIVS